MECKKKSHYGMKVNFCVFVRSGDPFAMWSCARHRMRQQPSLCGFVIKNKEKERGVTSWLKPKAHVSTCPTFPTTLR